MMRITVWTSWSVGLSMSALSVAQTQNVLYHATLVPRYPDYPQYGRLAPVDVNNLGQVVLRGEYPQLRTFRWDPRDGTLVDLGALPGGSGAWPGGINDLGQVVGTSGSSEGTQAFLWDQSFGMRGLGQLPPHPYTGASAVNNFSEVAGGAGDFHSGQAFLWTEQDGMIGLGDIPGGIFWSGAMDINDLTHVCGRADGPDRRLEGFFWSRETGMFAIGDLPGGDYYTEVWGMNNLDQIVGQSHSYNGVEAFVWDPQHGMIGLGNLGGPAHASIAHGINEHGQVVGLAARDIFPDTLVGFIWDGTNGMRDLNTLLDASSSDLRIGHAREINNFGQIITWGRGDWVLLSPVILGDLNCDGVVNLFDVEGFVLALLDRPAYLAAYPDCRHEGWAADVNQDAAINNFDIEPFIDLLIGP